MNLIQKNILILREVDESYTWFCVTSHSIFAGFDMVVTLLSLATQSLSFGCISVIIVYISELFPTCVPMVRLSVTVTTVVTWSISSPLHTTWNTQLAREGLRHYLSFVRGTHWPSVDFHHKGTINELLVSSLLLAEQIVWQIDELSVIWDGMLRMWHRCNECS